MLEIIEIVQLVITGINNFRSDAFNVIEPGSFPQTISVDDSLKFIIEFSPNEARHSNPFDKTLSVFTDDVSDAVFKDALMNTFYLDTIYVEDIDASDSVFTVTFLEGSQWLSLDSLGISSRTPAFTDTGSSPISICVADTDSLPEYARHICECASFFIPLLIQLTPVKVIVL